MNVCSQMSLSAVVLKSPLRMCVYLQTFEAALFWKKKNNTSQICMRMVGLVEMNSHRETTAVVSDALFMIIQSKSWFV